MSIPVAGGPGGLPTRPEPGLTCAEAKAQIASQTMTVANLERLLASTQDPVRRADLQAGISQGNQEIAYLRSQLPFLCGPSGPPPHPVISVLMVIDGDGLQPASFGAPDSA